MGADIVMKALRAPCRIIAENAGVEGEVSIRGESSLFSSHIVLGKVVLSWLHGQS